VASVQWQEKELDGGKTLRVPYLGEKYTLEAPFQQQIEQIVFPTMARDGIFNGYQRVKGHFVDLRILCCSNNE
jgi:hypothetical protein